MTSPHVQSSGQLAPRISWHSWKTLADSGHRVLGFVPWDYARAIGFGIVAPGVFPPVGVYPRYLLWPLLDRFPVLTTDPRLTQDTGKQITTDISMMRVGYAQSERALCHK
ncbi:MAG: hypothetical protein Q8R28_13925, partial [Dehalococcoidia bacterium]|nr:hypothetical protein [Dehalococcoidia bacterium]